MRNRCLQLALALAALTLCSYAQEQSPAAPAPVIRKESRLVLVDAVVTDKKGSYIRDLTADDFRVFDDDKEQPIRSFSVESSSAATTEHKRYLILFFDLASASGEGRQRAQDAALRFIDSDSARDRSIAIVEFAGSLKIKQNFTDNPNRLKTALGSMNSRSAPPSDSVSFGANLASAERDFDARSTLLALRSLARNLAAIPGRKSVVLFTSGFPVVPDQLSEITAVIDACNKANVVIYPVDVRGLIVSNLLQESSPLPVVAKASQESSRPAQRARSSQPRFPFASYMFSPDPQRGGGGSRGGGSRSGGSSRGSISSSTSRATPITSQPGIIPQATDGPMDNQAIMRMLANGTGGFVIANANDLLHGLEKISREQGEYYLLGYVPPATADGSCHELKVKVNRGGTIVRSRSGYCNVKSKDLLAGTETEKQLQAQLSGADHGIATSMSIPFFYTEPNVARVNLVIDIPGTTIAIEKEKDKYVASVNVLGIAYNPDGSVGGRFSDTAKTSFESKHDAEEFRKSPYHYEKQFELASGTYDLKVVFSSKGQAFGKLSAPLVIDPYDGKQIGISGIALVSNPKPATQALDPDAALTEDRSPILYRGLAIQPSATNRFDRKNEKPVLYAELYDDQLPKTEKPAVKVRYRIVDAATSQLKSDTGSFDYPSDGARTGSVVALCLKLPVETLAPGRYILQLVASSNGRDSTIRSVNFEVQ